jgi:hypothetical protein
MIIEEDEIIASTSASSIPNASAALRSQMQLGYTKEAVEASVDSPRGALFTMNRAGVRVMEEDDVVRASSLVHSGSVDVAVSRPLALTAMAAPVQTGQRHLGVPFAVPLRVVHDDEAIVLRSSLTPAHGFAATTVLEDVPSHGGSAALLFANASSVLAVDEAGYTHAACGNGAARVPRPVHGDAVISCTTVTRATCRYVNAAGQAGVVGTDMVRTA